MTGCEEVLWDRMGGGPMGLDGRGFYRTCEEVLLDVCRYLSDNHLVPTEAVESIMVLIKV